MRNSPLFDSLMYQANMPEQQQQQQGISPMQAYDVYQQFSGSSAPASSSTASASGSGTSGLLSNPYGWAAAMLLANNTMHNKGITSWNDHFKGVAGREAGNHFLEQWGIEEGDIAHDIAGVLGWGDGGGWLNPSMLNEKLWDLFD